MKHYLTSLLLVVSLALWAEDAPVWYNAASRASAYPSEIFVTGFAMQKVNSGESVEKAQEAVIEKARANAVSTIEVRIQNETEDRLQQLQYKGSDGTMNALQRYLQSVTRSSVDMEISGLKFEAYHDAANGRVAGFAYVKKTELIRQTDRKLTSTLTKIENGLDEMDELIRLGQKLQARQRGEKLAPLFVKAEDLQRLLIAVDPYADEESLQTAARAPPVDVHGGRFRKNRTVDTAGVYPFGDDIRRSVLIVRRPRDAGGCQIPRFPSRRRLTPI